MTGIEWIVEAHGCSPDRLRDLATLQLLFARMVSELDLHPCGDDDPCHLCDLNCPLADNVAT